MSSVARLIYDSAREGALLGTRGGFGVDRMLLFRGPGISVDVVLPIAGRQVKYLHGQVTDERQDQPLAGLPVHLGDRTEPVRTDAFGQFALGLVDGRGCSVVRVLGPGGPIDCIIPDVDLDGAE